MKCEIQWNNLSLEEWQKKFSSIYCSNILQDYNYVIASAKTNRQKARWGLILIEGKEAGLVQLLEASMLWGAIHGIILDRGPLWFDGFGGAAHIQAFFKEFNAQFPKRLGRKRRILPEILDGAAAQNILKQIGLNHIESQTGYQSLWWNLEGDEAARENLKSNWRGSLRKAENADLEILWDDQNNFYSWLKLQYIMDKEIRGYSGISPQLLDNLATVSTSTPSMLIGKARHNKEDIAAILILMHGQSATYQIGWASDFGRKNSAHNLLLWQARQKLRDYDIKDLDLGGVNDEASAEGLKKFKTGTGATLYRLVGQYD